MKKLVLLTAIALHTSFIFAQIKIPTTTMDFAAGAAFNKIGNSDFMASPFISGGVSHQLSPVFRASFALSVNRRGIDGFSGTFFQPELAIILIDGPFSFKTGGFVGSAFQRDTYAMKDKDAGVIGGLSINTGIVQFFGDCQLGMVNVYDVENDTRKLLDQFGIDVPESKTLTIKAGIRLLL